MVGVDRSTWEGNLFYHFLYPLYDKFFAFNVFRYITFRSAYATITALLICFLFGPPLVKIMRQLGTGEQVREYTPSTHEKKAGTPSMGGIIILLAILASSILWGNLSNRYTILVLTSTFGYGVIGFLDDYLKFVKKSSKGLHDSSSSHSLLSQPLLPSTSISSLGGVLRQHSCTFPL